ncbi:MAG TPA: hypothetical protein VGA73_15845, partial [Candidatus Binatia bacterium]
MSRGAESKLPGVLVLGAVLLAWETASRMGWVNPLLFPAMSKILGAFFALVFNGDIPAQVLASMRRAA